MSFNWQQLESGGSRLRDDNKGISAITVTAAGLVTFPASLGGVPSYVDVTVTSAQILALFATPKTLVAAPGAGLALLFEGAFLFLDYGTAAYAGIATGEDLSIKYTGAAGVEVAQIESTGFLDATADELRYVRPLAAAAIEIVANAALVLHGLIGEIITGDSPLKLRVFYRVIPSTL